jgi:hypothetical protein
MEYSRIKLADKQMNDSMVVAEVVVANSPESDNSKIDISVASDTGYWLERTRSHVGITTIAHTAHYIENGELKRLCLAFEVHTTSITTG